MTNVFSKHRRDAKHLTRKHRKFISKLHYFQFIGFTIMDNEEGRDTLHHSAVFN